MKISIITTIYKAENDLPRLLDSMMAQKSSELEFFLIDNGSPDRCGEICREYTKKDSRFTVHTLDENIGYIRARNLGIELVEADYIGFADSDDYLEPNGYDIAVEKIKKSNCDLYLTSYNTVENNIPRLCNVPFKSGEYCGNKIKDEILPQLFGSLNGKPILHGFAWKQVFKKSILIDNAISFMPELQPYEDQILNIDVVKKCSKIFVDDTVIYNYVVNPDSITAKIVSQFNPKSEWERICLFYEEKSKRAENEIHKTAISNQIMSLIYSLVLNTSKMDILLNSAAKKLNDCLDTDAVSLMVRYSTVLSERAHSFILWCIRNKKYRLLIFVIRTLIRIKK